MLTEFLIGSPFHAMTPNILFRLGLSRPRGAVARAEAQRSDDPYVPGSNPTVGHGCRSIRMIQYKSRSRVAVGVARKGPLTAKSHEC
jgi:hypothetical protein